MPKSNNQTITEQVVKTIMSGIQKGTFPPGTRLPSQRELSEMFGVSRMVIREAIKTLEGKGVLFSKRGSGIFVRQDFPDQENSPLGSINDYSMYDINTLSSLIWEGCADLIVENATDDELQDLYNRTTDMYENYGFNTTLQAKYIYESSFGLTICKMTHNKLIYKLMVEMLAITSKTDYLVVKNNTNYKKMIEIDLKVLEALMDRDAHRAKLWSHEREVEIKKVISQNNLEDLVSGNQSTEV